VTSLSGSVFHKFVAFGTNELWKAFVQAKGWWRRNCLYVHWKKTGSQWDNVWRKVAQTMYNLIQCAHIGL